jgi:PKD repeat protein
LFADFTVNYPCENGMTTFADKSAGTATKWKWNFPESIVKEGKDVETSFLKPGIHSITLTVSNETETNGYTTDIIVKQNSLPANQILINQDQLISLQSSANYRWYGNGLPIPSETSRSYSYPTGDAVYSVLTYNDECNRISEAITITNVTDTERRTVKIYPNPASSELIVENNGDQIKVIVFDIIKRIMVSKESRGGKLTIPIHEWKEGIYFIEIISDEKHFVSKFSVEH